MNRSRRAFLAAAPALPAAARAIGRPAPVTEASRYASFDPWVELNTANVAHNVSAIARLTGRPILAVIKNNGYGAGLVHIARALEPLAPIHGFAVVKIDEAFRLRDAGLRKPILLMGPFDERHISDLAERAIQPMVYTRLGAELERAAARLRRPVAVHVCVDTGIGRVGVPHRQAADFLRALNARNAAHVSGTMMTFTEDPDFDREQLSRFITLLDGLTREGVKVGQRHAASSYTLFQHKSDSFLDLVRPGMVIYGVYPEPPFRAPNLIDLRPALALRTRVVYVKQLRAGESAGYNRAFKAERDVWVATLPVGHADGVPRAAATGAKVRIGDVLYPIVASISASHSIVEIGAEPAVKIGDVATVFDWRDGSRPEDVSTSCGVSVYDLLMHLNPLLERRVA
ncbi:MAG TPA: alanine racemase [Vicinamibacterales bacterium]|nr:alanine racemase [Vicinamibacterales bacterium]